MRLIDADKVYDDMLGAMCGTGYQTRALDVIEFAPEIDSETLMKELHKQQWISVEDRLPEVYRDEYDELIPFLVCVQGERYPFRALYDGKHWGDGWAEIKVAYWMPLPEPPKTGDVDD